MLSEAEAATEDSAVSDGIRGTWCTSESTEKVDGESFTGY